MNKESTIKQLKRIKQEMTHADDVNALDFAIRFMNNKTPEKIRAEIEDLRFGQPLRKLVVDECLEIIDKYREG